MSVLPVSDALKRLEEDGLVETRARAGTRVKVPTRTDVRELYELREALETQAARLFAERATAVHRRELRRLAGHVDALFAGWRAAAKTTGSALPCTASTCSSTCGSPSTPTASCSSR